MNVMNLKTLKKRAINNHWSKPLRIQRSLKLKWTHHKLFRKMHLASAPPHLSWSDWTTSNKMVTGLRKTATTWMPTMHFHNPRAYWTFSFITQKSTMRTSYFFTLWRWKLVFICGNSKNTRTTTWLARNSYRKLQNPSRWPRKIRSCHLTSKKNLSKNPNLMTWRMMLLHSRSYRQI